MSYHQLILFIKWPEAGGVKTRLQPQLTPGQSLLIYQAMVEDLVEGLGDATAFELAIYFWPPDREAGIRRWLGEKRRYLPQRGHHLGEKMFNAFSESARAGARKTIIIGSDLPTLAKPDIESALWTLDNADLVLGPTSDGGYYLIGLNAPDRRVFEAVEWSTKRVMQKTLDNAAAAGLKMAQLPKQSDIDTFAEVRQLWRLLQGAPNDEMIVRIPRTYAFLKTLFGD